MSCGWRHPHAGSAPRGIALVAPNGQVIATSESYESRASALNGIESVKRNARGAGVDDQTKR
jgi:uncharacterized protein YegP (UPF0339 family)